MPTHGEHAEYDDLVVGAGSAGAALAARLSEDGSRRVALIEAGVDYPQIDQTPRDLIDGSAMSLADHDWQFYAEILDGRKIRFPRGKVTGGSSAVGATVALRGIPDDYDEWAAAGNPDWAFPQVLPFFRTLEDDLDFHGEFHGRGGPIPVRRWRADELAPVQQSFMEACQQVGYPYAEDHNHPDSTGVGPIPSNRRGPELRVSTAMTYLAAARSRENLTIIPQATVTKVLLRDGQVHGVQVVSGSAAADVPARRVILAAGAIGSPAILLRSGIGPREELRRLGIEVTAHLPGVGAQLIDHPRTGVFMVPKAGAENFGMPFLQMLLRTTASGSRERNDLQYYMVSHFDLTLFPELQLLAGGTRIFGVMVVHQRPRSRGRLRLSSADPHAAPEIHLNFLADDNDLQILVDGVRTCWKLANSPKISSQAERLIVLNESAIASDDAVRTYVKVSLDSAYHPVGTAPMGPASDPRAVVSQRCQVHGIDGLYVADASVMPSIVRANTNLTSIMIGERVAAWLRSA